MRRPGHIILNFEKQTKLETNWLYKFVTQKNDESSILLLVKPNKDILQRKFKNKMIRNSKKYTVRHSSDLDFKYKKVSPVHPIDLTKLPLSNIKKKSDLQEFLTIKKSNKKLNLNLAYYRNTYRKIYFILSYLLKTKSQLNKSNILFKLVNINFLRKERLYTKLKYSRSPAFDIVSGGAAALLAGFIGFLISEKYGFELVDSGDFYYFFMYLVFLTFSLRPLLVSLDFGEKLSQVVLPKAILNFYYLLFFFLLKKFK